MWRIRAIAATFLDTSRPGWLRWDSVRPVRNGLAGCDRGDIAQLGERGVRNAEVAGSSPAISTNLFLPL